MSRFTIMSTMSKGMMIWVTGCIVFLLLLQGCGVGSRSGVSPSAAVTSGTGTIVGQVAPVPGASIVLRGANGDREVVLDAQGRFSANVTAGTYQVLLKTSDGKLELVKRSLTVEDNLTVSVVDVSMVPMPRVTAVSVPLIYRDSAVVEWETDIESDGRIDYGIDAGYGYSSFTDTELKTKHRVQIYGLSAQTTYHFRVVASRHGLETIQSFSSDYSFVTE